MTHASPASISSGGARTGNRRARFAKIALRMAAGGIFIALLAFAGLIYLASFMVLCGCG